MEYPAAVRDAFFHPRHHGPLAGGRNCRGTAGDSGAGERVEFEARIRDGRIDAIAFRAYGSPWVIAACERLAAALTGAAVATARACEPSALAAELSLPPEKRSSLLTVQDALRNCLVDWDTTQPVDGPPGRP